MRILSLLLFALFLQLSGQAAIVDTVSIPSKAMRTTFKCVVFMPDNYAKDTDKSKRYPVVYLLHGYGGWYSNYVTRLPEIVKYGVQVQFIIVTPEG
jgi:predicted alpha/beta superfamily hydrolase